MVLAFICLQNCVSLRLIVTQALVPVHSLVILSLSCTAVQGSRKHGAQAGGTTFAGNSTLHPMYPDCGNGLLVRAVARTDLHVSTQENCAQPAC